MKSTPSPKSRKPAILICLAAVLLIAILSLVYYYTCLRPDVPLEDVSKLVCTDSETSLTDRFGEWTGEEREGFFFLTDEAEYQRFLAQAEPVSQSQFADWDQLSGGGKLLAVYVIDNDLKSELKNVQYVRKLCQVTVAVDTNGIHLIDTGDFYLIPVSSSLELEQVRLLQKDASLREMDHIDSSFSVGSLFFLFPIFAGLAAAVLIALVMVYRVWKR